MKKWCLSLFLLLSQILSAQTELKEKVAPVVVSIEVERTADPEGERIYRGNKTLTDYYSRPKAPVTGTIISSDGFIITSYFNLSGTIKMATVKTQDGKSYEATLLGADKEEDIALIKIDADGLATLKDGKIEKIEQGDFVALVGKSPNATLSTGIISATSRLKNTAFGFDAKVNYGNAGGAVVDLEGNLLGIATHINPQTMWGQSSGVGFATKIDQIKKVLPRLKNKEIIEKTKEPYLGVLPVEGEEETEGVKIAQVAPNSPAQEAGLKPDDIILEIDGVKLNDADQLRKIVTSKKAGDEITLKIESEGAKKTVKIKLGER